MHARWVAVALATVCVSCSSRPATLNPNEPGGDASPAYAFLRVDPGTREPVRFDPCTPIHYVINPEGAPAWGEAMIVEVLAEVGRLTGYTFVFDGKTDERAVLSPPPDLRAGGIVRERDYAAARLRYPGRWPPVLFFWARDPDKEYGTGLDREVGGSGGPDRALANGKERFVTGVVSLNPRLTQQVRLRYVLRHEVGHLLGLDHVVSRTQLMNATHQRFEYRAYADGDRAGFREIGREKGCLEPLAPGSVPIEAGAPPNEGHSAPK